MAKQSLNILKAWYVTFAKPVQDQFWDWLDSFRHKDDKIVLDDLHQNLQDAIQAAAAGQNRPDKLDVFFNSSYLIPAGVYLLRAIAVVNKSGNSMTLRFGTTNGGDEVCELTILENGHSDVDVGIWFFEETEIYITGVEGHVEVYIDKK
ncbi:MAG TPA: hypothetical protein PKC39_14475 [Ferruginibacter sp.]|nr:hypothetical protein [Ferruginibacter sp.]HMP22161.1 hypothetical protein [Ferruginibacter sp.]